MVVVNLYAFEKTAARPGVHFEEIIENIDIGGPSMVRSAAKNFQDVAIVTSPADYTALADEMAKNGGSLSLPTKWRLAQKAFATTAAYDSAIASALERISAADAEVRYLPSSRTEPNFLRRCASPSRKLSTCATARTLTRKQLSIPTAPGSASPTENSSRAKNSPTTTLSTCKPPGTSRRSSRSRCAPSSSTPTRAALPSQRHWSKHISERSECDPVSAFGGVIGVNRAIDAAAAEEMAKLFLEVIAAPVSAKPRSAFAAKKNLRLVEVQPSRRSGY